MSRSDVPYRHSVHFAIELLKGRWTVAVMAELAVGERQYREILTAINKVEEQSGSQQRPLTDRVLTDTLGRAVRDGLIERHAETGHFKRVWYTLTPMGRRLLRAVRPLAEWAKEHHEYLDRRGGRLDSEQAGA